MLSVSAFERWCQRLAFPEETTKTIIRIRSSPPSRLVRSGAGNVSGRYTSKKMGCSIQYESYKNELPFIYYLEHEASVLEFYDQPEKIELVYQNKDATRRVVVKHTPDFFVLQEEAAGWVECKMEEDLVRLAKQSPHRYVPNSDGTWSCPPGEAYAKPMGLFYQIRSSREIDWIVYRNCRFLQQYRTPSRKLWNDKTAHKVVHFAAGKRCFPTGQVGGLLPRQSEGTGRRSTNFPRPCAQEAFKGSRYIGRLAKNTSP